MNITKVGYGKTINLGNYENAKYYFEAEINEGENWQVVVEQLQGNIAEFEQKQKDIKSLEEKVTSLALREGRIRYDIEMAERKLADFQERWKEASGFLRQHGINPDSYHFEFLPAEEGEQQNELVPVDDPHSDPDYEEQAF